KRASPDPCTTHSFPYPNARVLPPGVTAGGAGKPVPPAVLELNFLKGAVLMRYDAEALKEFSIQIMCRCGLSREESEIFSDSLIRADLRGISSHGLTRLTAYARRVELGLVSGHVTPEILRDGGSVLA